MTQGIGPGQDTGSNILDFSLTEREFLELPTTSITRTGNRVDQIVRSGDDPRGITHTVTEDMTRDGNGRISQIVRTFTGGGVTRTVTHTVNRDGNQRVATIPNVRS